MYQTDVIKYVSGLDLRAIYSILQFFESSFSNNNTKLTACSDMDPTWMTSVLTEVILKFSAFGVVTKSHNAMG